MTQPVPEGWYADPQDASPGAERWWNGHSWTAHTRVEAPPRPPPPGHAPAGGWGPSTPTSQPPKTLADGTPVAELGPRLGAYAIDVGLVYLTVSLALLVVDGFTSIGESFGVTSLAWSFIGAPVKALLIATLWMVYQVVLLTRGQPTLGKRVLGLRVRPLDRDVPLDARAAAIRALAGSAGLLIVLFPGSQLFGLALMGYDAYRMQDDWLDRPWHDQLVDTVVVRAPGR
ncbi:MAG: RDD family protein [Nocardioides sp.]